MTKILVDIVVGIVMNNIDIDEVNIRNKPENWNEKLTTKVSIG